MPAPVTIPLLNPNEPEAVLAAVHVHEGQRVSAGDSICTVETTKSAADVAAERDGYITHLRLQAGQAVRAGDVLCYLSDAPDEQLAPGIEFVETAGEQSPSGLPPGLRITAPALQLARRLNLDLNQFPPGPMITESAVRSMVEESAADRFALPELPFDASSIIVYGGGGHGKMVLDVLRSMGTYHVAGIIDDGRQPGELVLGVPVLGGAGLLPDLQAKGVRLAVNAVGGISNISARIAVFRRLTEAGFAFPILVHRTASVEPSAFLAQGSQVFTHAYIGSQARIGFGAIINSGAIVSHDCVLGNYVNLSPGAILAGEVHTGDGVLIGMGATINLGVKIGSGARIGNGATVKSDVPAGGLVRAGTIWPE